MCCKIERKPSSLALGSPCSDFGPVRAKRASGFLARPALPGGTQLGRRGESPVSEVSLTFVDPSLRGCTSRLPGAWSLEMLGVSGWPRY